MQVEILRHQVSNAERQREHRRKKEEEGLRAITVYIPGERYEELKVIAKEWCKIAKEIKKAKKENGLIR